MLLVSFFRSPRQFFAEHVTFRKTLGFGLDVAVLFVVLVFVTALIWAKFVIHDHMLPTTVGDFHTGVVEIPEVLTPGMKVVSFSAVFVPPEVITFLGIPVPVTESLEVTVAYQRHPGANVEIWTRKYLVARTSEKQARWVVLRGLSGIVLSAKGVDVDGKGTSWDWLPLIRNAPRPPMPPTPPSTLKPQPTIAPDTLIASML